MENNSVQLCTSLLDADRRWTVRELAVEVRVYHKTVLHILHNILGYCKVAARWIPHEISKVQQWNCYAITQALLDLYQRKCDDFLGQIIAMDETWAHSYEANSKRQSNEWKHPGSPHPNKVCPTQCAVKVMFSVTYDIEGVILHHTCTSNADNKCCILLHIPAAPPSSRAQEKTTILSGTELHHSS